jgi:hypothetical protein
MSKHFLSSVSTYDINKSAAHKLKNIDRAERPVSDEDKSEFMSATLQADIEEVMPIVDAMVTGSYEKNGKSKSIKDVMLSTDFPAIFQAATEIFISNTLYPSSVVTDNLFQTIPYSGNNSTITIRSLGGVHVEEVPEGAKFPETGGAVSDIAYRIHTEIKKIGSKIAGTRELLESDNWGVFGFLLRQLAIELKQEKERRASKLINNFAGYTLIDNAAADSSDTLIGGTTGRGIDGSANGALSIDDVMAMMAYAELRGYPLDTMLIHPFMWLMWQRDPDTRDVILGSKVEVMPSSGSAAPGWGDMFGGLGYNFGKFGSSISTTTPSLAQAGLSGFNTVDPNLGKLGISQFGFPNLTPFGATFQATPKYIDRPIKIVVTPLVPYYKVSGGTYANKYATNLIMACSSKCGLIFQKENPAMEEWEDKDAEVNWVKIREKYGMALLDQGRGVYLAKNVICDRNYGFSNVNTATLSEINNRVSLL